MTDILCAYGCGNIALYFNRKNVGRCVFKPSMCSAIRLRAKESIKHKYASKTDEEKQAIKSKRSATNILKYGVSNVSSVQSIKLTREQTFIDRFGVSNPSLNASIIEKIKLKWPDIKDKRAITSIEKYGTEHYSNTDEFKQRRVTTWLKKYGVDNPSKHPDILNKIMKGQDYRKTNKIIILNSVVNRVQGYEDRVIKDLIKSGIPESEIICDRKRIPKISYCINGKLRTYYPDIFLPRYNLLIEVKSLYIWKKYKDVNIAKINAAKQNGYNIRVAIR